MRRTRVSRKGHVHALTVAVDRRRHRRRARHRTGQRHDHAAVRTGRAAGRNRCAIIHAEVHDFVGQRVPLVVRQRRLHAVG